MYFRRVPEIGSRTVDLVMYQEKALLHIMNIMTHPAFILRIQHEEFIYLLIRRPILLAKSINQFL